MKLRVGDVTVAEYVTDPQLDIRLAPRPFLHPVRTLGGRVVTDSLPSDHPWHLGVSLTVADVNDRNFWGGRTYVRDQGYIWRDDHGRVVHSEWLSPVPDSSSAVSAFDEALGWVDGEGREILRERRSVSAAAVAHGWELSFRYELTPAGPDPVVLGSPATNGRSEGAGYGGFFWRAGPGKAHAFTASSDEPNGSAEPWVALTVDDAYTLVFRGLSGDDRWFVRTEEYAGVCAALAFEDELHIPADSTLTRTVRVLVADGVLTRSDVTAALA